MNFALLLTRVEKLWSVVTCPSHIHALIWFGVLASAEHRAVLKSTFRTIVDIGANRGQFALACRRWASQSRIISFEPLPGPVNLLRKLMSNDEYVRVIGAAIGPNSARCEIHVSGRDDSSSLLPISQTQVEMFPGTGEVDQIFVEVGPLEFYVGRSDIVRPAMLKLDVQGYEFDALCGCESLLDEFDAIYCECSFVELYLGQKLAHDVIAWLSKRGFVLNGIYNASFDADGQAIQADFHFLRSSFSFSQ